MDQDQNQLAQFLNANARPGGMASRAPQAQVGNAAPPAGQATPSMQANQNQQMRSFLGGWGRC